MYKLRISFHNGAEVIKIRDKGNRSVVLRAFAEAKAMAGRGTKVKVVVRAPDGRVTKHNFKGVV